jgi:hypothetical protein
MMSLVDSVGQIMVIAEDKSQRHTRRGDDLKERGGWIEFSQKHASL